MERIIAFMLFLLLNSISSLAQNHSSFKKVEGLNSNVVYCVMQDSKGYIWVGTEAGAARYDGYGFRYFTKDDGLTDNDIFQIHEDKKGRLWFLTYNGEPTIYDHGKILTPSNTPFLSKIKPGIMARSWVQHGDSIWYVTMYTAYLFVHDELKEELHAKDIFKNGNSSFMELLSHEKEPILVTNSGVYYPLTRKTISLTTKYGSLLLAQKVLYVREKILFAHGASLIVYNLKDSTIKRPVDLRLRARWPLGVFYSKEDGKVMLLGENMLYKYNLETEQVTKELAFNIPFADYILVDKDKDVWIASLNQGLFFKQPSVVNTLDLSTQLNTKTAYSLGKNGNTVYAGFINGEYMQWKQGKASMLQSHASYRNKVYGFYPLNRKLLLLTGNDMYDIISKQSIRSSGAIKNICANSTHAYIGFSFSIKKVALDTFRSDVYLRPEYDSSTVYNKRVNAMLTVGDDSVFLCGLDGLKLLVKDKLTTFPNQQLSIFNTGISKIIKGNPNQFVCSSTGKGIAVFDGKNCWVIDKAKGLASNVCNSVFMGKANTIWAATNNGISKVSYTISNGNISCKVKNYTSADGLYSNAVNDVLVHDDTVWLATDNGVCFFREDEMQQAPNPINVVIEEFYVNTKPIDASTHIVLQHTENNIRIDFTGLSYSSANSIQYRYKLEGADTGWNYTTARRIEYPNLSHGKYVFMVSASNANGEWNGAVQKIQFDIAAPFWKTAWFIIASIILLLAIFFFVTKSIFKNIQAKHAMQQKQLGYEKQLLQLEQQALHLQMNPHFIFNAMNAIKGFYAAANKQAANEYIDKFAGLMRMILERNAQPAISLQDEITMLTAYLELAALRQEDKFMFDITVAKGINTFKTLIPSMLLQPFVENAVVHGIAPLPSGGKIVIHFSVEDKMLVCTIKDNGIGRQQSKQLKKYSLHQSKGIGITQQRLLLLSPQSKLAIEDVVADDRRIAGTCVTLHLPLLLKEPTT